MERRGHAARPRPRRPKVMHAEGACATGAARPEPEQVCRPQRPRANDGIDEASVGDDCLAIRSSIKGVDAADVADLATHVLEDDRARVDSHHKPWDGTAIYTLCTICELMRKQIPLVPLICVLDHRLQGQTARPVQGPTPLMRSTRMRVMYPAGGSSIGGNFTSGPK
jgi:hypothetical protein